MNEANDDPQMAPVSGKGGMQVSDEAASRLFEDALAAADGTGVRDWKSPEAGDWDGEFGERYVIHALLGRGGMGSVYRATQVELERVVAIKILPIEFGRDEDFVERFRHEARSMARLQHPGIVTVYDFGQTATGFLYYVMELVEGPDLHFLIRTECLALPKALNIVSQVCDALSYAHRHGLVHRDIKPANILVDAAGRAKITDFGLVRPVGPEPGKPQLTATGYVMGTQDYMSPEQRAGLEVDHRADLFAVGIMLYEMLTGHPPVGAWQAPSACTGCDRRLDPIVNRAIQPHPDERYQSAEEIKTALAKVSTRLRAVTGVSAPQHAWKRWAAGLLLAGTLAWAGVWQNGRTVASVAAPVPPTKKVAKRIVYPRDAKLEDAKPGEEREFELKSGAKMKFCWCPAGEFVMGDFKEGKVDASGARRAVKVRITKGFWMAKYECLRGQWLGAVGWTPREIELEELKDDNLPLSWASWDECRVLLKSLKASPGWRFELPTDAQWEYACRAGRNGMLLGKIDEMAWARPDAGDKPHAVGLKKPNAWGLYDMQGNMLEWCRDAYREPLADGDDPCVFPRLDPPADLPMDWVPPTPDLVYRGFSFKNYASESQKPLRGGFPPRTQYGFVGFRLVLERMPDA